jgi:accessory gene regulator B
MLIASTVIFIWSFYIVCKYAPVDSPRKPIRTETKRARMKKDSLIVLSVYLVILPVLLAIGLQKEAFNSYGISLLFGVAWQILSLTLPGAFLLHSVDKLFERRCKT